MTQNIDVSDILDNIPTLVRSIVVKYLDSVEVDNNGQT